MVGGESGGPVARPGWDRLLRALLLFPLVSQKLGTFIASENAADLRVLRDLIESRSIARHRPDLPVSQTPPLSGMSKRAAPAARSSSPSDKVPAAPGQGSRVRS